MKSKQGGFALIGVMVMMGVLLALLGTYYTITELESGSIKASRRSIQGFYAAEAGLNIRAEDIRQRFLGYSRPTGTSPTTPDPCATGNTGSGDYACQSVAINNRTAQTYVEEEAGNPIILTIPPGELYQGLNAQEYRYTVNSRSISNQGKVESILQLRFKSRLVPLFQFMAFYDKDLEILPGPLMTMNGPVHTNGDLYLNTGNTLNMTGQVSMAGRLFRGRKDNSTCTNNQVRIFDPINPLTLVPTCPSRTQVLPANVTAWNGQIRIGVDSVTVPDPGVLDPGASNVYFNKADLRLALRLDSSNNPSTSGYSPTGVEVRDLSNNMMGYETGQLHGCSGSISSRPIGFTYRFYNNREARGIRMLEIDMQGLLNCLRSTNWLGTGKQLNDSTEGGIVFHLTVDGPDSAAASNSYGVRIRNAATLASNISGAPAILGMTVATDQAIYVLGDYNSTAKKPAALMADTLNILSNSWMSNIGAREPNTPPTTVSLSSRPANATTINAAVMANTDRTNLSEGTPCTSQCQYNGGLENYPRFHENWSGQTITYRGSFVSLGAPRHQAGVWAIGGVYYNAPNRAYAYDTDFNNAANLPPLTPRFVYLRQELFVRDYERE